MLEEIGTPAVMLGFTRDELGAMEERAWPDPVEAWLHGLVTAALEDSVSYQHKWASCAIAGCGFRGSDFTVDCHFSEWHEHG